VPSDSGGLFGSNGKTNTKLLAAGLVALGVYLGELRSEVASMSRRLDNIERYVMPQQSMAHRDPRLRGAGVGASSDD